jgi:hypothetical protein
MILMTIKNPGINSRAIDVFIIIHKKTGNKSPGN